MRNVISFPVRTYVDFETKVTQTDGSGKPKKQGELLQVSVDPAYVLTDGRKTELVNFVRRFRQWKWKGSKHVIVPVARAPVDPAHITYNSNQPTVDPFDLMLFHAYKRWKNQYQTVPPPTSDFPERYFLMDVSWRKTSIFKPFSMFTRPYISNIGQMMQTSHFTIGSSNGADFDPTKLHADTAEPRYDTTNGTPLSHDVIATQGGFINSQAQDILISSTFADVDEHRHYLMQDNQKAWDRYGGVLQGTLRTPSLVDKAKAFLTGEENLGQDQFMLETRARCVEAAVPDGTVDEKRGLIQANLTGHVNVGDPTPASQMSPLDVRSFSTSTEHGHDTNVHTGIQEMMAEAHQHYLADEDVATIQTRHTHPINARHLAQGLSFTYDAPAIPPQSMPWWSTSSASYVYGRRPVRGWVDTRQASFVTGELTDSLYSPTWPAFLWRLPKHFHTKYVFRVWVTHYFALRSPIIHELYTSPTDALADIMEEEGIEQDAAGFSLSLRRPSTAVGIHGLTEESEKTIQDILARADAEMFVPTVEPTE